MIWHAVDKPFAWPEPSGNDLCFVSERDGVEAYANYREVFFFHKQTSRVSVLKRDAVIELGKILERANNEQTSETISGKTSG